MPFIGKGNCKVFCRIFPLNDTRWDLIKIKNSLLYVKNLHDSSRDNNDISKFWTFKHDAIFSNESQEFICSKITNEVIDSVMKGFNGIVIGYGQTGSGKSFTMHGLHYSEKEFGVSPRIIIDLFKIKKALPSNIKMCIEMSYIEFSKRIVVDLLKNLPNAVDAWHVKNASKILVKSEFDALKLLYRGEGRKSFAKCNEYLSHIGSSVLTFHITTENIEFSNLEKISSRLHIVDMAGIDSVGNVSSIFKNSQDIGKANTIKSDMEQFMAYLVRNVPRLIQLKERTNPLIYYLGADLASENVLRFIGHVRIQEKYFKILMSTLRFGQAARGLKPKMKEIVSEITDEIKIQYLQNKLERLKREKIFYSVLLNQDLTKDLDRERTEHLRAIVHAYLHNRITELTILNVAEASEVFRFFRDICATEEEIQVSEIESAKKHTSKTASGISVTNNQRSGKKKRRSKESVTTLEKTKTATSAASLRGKISIHINRKSSIRSSQKPFQVKRIMSNTASIVVSRRSTTSSSIKDKSLESKGYMTDTALLPDVLPNFKQIWNVFTGDTKSTYRNLYGAFKANELELKQVYLAYQKEITKLQQFKDIVEKRKTELLEAKMFQQFISKSSVDIVITDSQKVCQENLDHAQTKLLEQQELVLKLQGELKLYLENRREIKEKIQEDFHQYCKDHYKIVIPNLVEDEEGTIMTEETLNLDFKVDQKEFMEEEEVKAMESVESVRFDILKKIMEKELQKNIKLKELRKRCWKNWV